MKILIGGDFTTCNRGLDSVKNKNAFSTEIKQIMQEADICIVNLEAPIAYEDKYKIRKVGPNLKTSSIIIPYLKDCGVDVLTLANNHFFDYGEHGVKATIEEIKKNNIDYVGGGQTPDEYQRILYKSVNNVTIAILNYCESEFSVNKNIGSNPIDAINVFYDIQAVRSKADYIIVITHGGHEGYNLPSPRMQKLYRYFIDLGVDVVVNHHQHCYSGYEEYHNGAIFYGLGNLFFDHVTPENKKGIWNSGFLLEIKIENSISFKTYPYEQCVGSNVSVELLKDNTAFEKTIIKLNDIINNPEKLEKSFDMWSSNQGINQLAWFTPYANRYLLALYRRKLLPSFISSKKKLQLLNMLRCESHRDLCINILSKKR